MILQQLNNNKTCMTTIRLYKYYTNTININRYQWQLMKDIKKTVEEVYLAHCKPFVLSVTACQRYINRSGIIVNGYKT